MIRLLAIACLFGTWLPAQGAIETFEFESAAEEQRFRALVGRLRCPKCQNQSIAGSNAPIARDLLERVHRLVREGRSDEEIVDHLVARYGEFVNYRPRLSPTTWALWFGPGIGVIGAAAAVVIWVRRRAAAGSSDLAEAEEQRLSEILEDKSGNPSA